MSRCLLKEQFQRVRGLQMAQPEGRPPPPPYGRCSLDGLPTAHAMRRQFSELHLFFR